MKTLFQHFRQTFAAVFNSMAVVCFSVLFGVAASAISAVADIRQSSPKDEERYTQLIRALGREDFRQALEIGVILLRQSGQNDKYDDAYARVIQAALSLNQLKTAEDIFQSLLDAVPANPKAHYGFGLLHKHRRNDRAAIASFQQCLASLPDFPPAILELVDAYARENALDQAEQFLSQPTVARPNNATWNFGRGQIALKRNQAETAFRFLARAAEQAPRSPFFCYQQALAFQQSLRFLDSLAVINICEPKTLENLTQTDRHHFRLLEGFNHILLGNYGRGETIFKALLTSALAFEDQDFVTAGYGYLGRIYVLQDRYEEALDVYRKAYTLALTSNSASALVNRRKYPGRFGRIYYQLGDYDASLRWLEEALKATDKERHASDWALWKNYQGDVWLALKQTQKAIECLTESARTSERIGDVLSRIGVMDNLSKVYFQQGDYTKAEELLRTGLSLVREAGDYERELLLLNRLGGMASRRKQPEEAIGWHQQERDLAGAKNSPQHLISAYGGLAHAYRISKRFDPAYKNFQLAVKEFEQTRVQILAENNKLSFQQSGTQIYREFAALLMEMHRTEPSKGWEVQARDYAERARARALLDGISAIPRQLEATLSPSLRKRRHEIFMRFSQTEVTLTQAFSENNKSKIEASQAALNQIAEEFRLWQEQVRRFNSHYASLHFPEPLTVKQVQQLLKQP